MDHATVKGYGTGRTFSPTTMVLIDASWVQKYPKIGKN
jgi:hypothetical protein